MVSSATPPIIAQVAKAQLLLDACMLFKRGDDARVSQLLSANLAKVMAKTCLPHMVAYKQQSYQEAAAASTSLEASTPHMNHVQNMTRSPSQAPSLEQAHLLTYEAFEETCLNLAQTLQAKPENAADDNITSIIAHNKRVIQKAFKHVEAFLQLPVALDLKNTLSSEPSDSLKKTLKKHKSDARNLYEAFFDQEKSILIKNMATQSILSAEIDSVYVALQELARIVHKLPKNIDEELSQYDENNQENKKKSAYAYIAGELKGVLDHLACLPGTVARLKDDININQIKNQWNGGILDVEIKNQLTTIAQNSIETFFTSGMHIHLPLNLQYVFLRLHSIGADVTKSIEELKHIYQNSDTLESENNEHLQEIMAGDPYIMRGPKIQGTYGRDRTSNFIQAALELPKNILPFLIKSIQEFIFEANHLIGHDMKALENLFVKYQDVLQVFMPNHPKYLANKKSEITEPNFLLDSEENKTVLSNQNDELNYQVNGLRNKLTKAKGQSQGQGQKNILHYEEIELDSLIHIAQLQQGFNQHMHARTQNMTNYAMPTPWDKVPIWNADKKIDATDIEYVVECVLHNCMTSILTEDELKQFGFVFNHEKNNAHDNNDKPIDLNIKNFLDNIDDNIGDTPLNKNKFLFKYILISVNLPEDKKTNLHDFFAKQNTDVQKFILDNCTSFLKIFDLLGDQDCHIFCANTPSQHLIDRINTCARPALKNLMQNEKLRKNILAPNNASLEAWNAISKTLDYIESLDNSRIIEKDLDHFITLYHQEHKIPSCRISNKGYKLYDSIGYINKIPDDLIELKSKFYHLAGLALGDNTFKKVFKKRENVLNFIFNASFDAEWNINNKKFNYKNPATDAEKKFHKKIEIMEFAIATENPAIIKKMIQGLPPFFLQFSKEIKNRISRAWQMLTRGTSVNDIERLDQLLKTLKEMHENTNQP